jgi:hypothetical protein
LPLVNSFYSKYVSLRTKRVPQQSDERQEIKGQLSKGGWTRGFMYKKHETLFYLRDRGEFTVCAWSSLVEVEEVSSTTEQV